MEKKPQKTKEELINESEELQRELEKSVEESQIIIKETEQKKEQLRRKQEQKKEKTESLVTEAEKPTEVNNQDLSPEQKAMLEIEKIKQNANKKLDEMGENVNKKINEAIENKNNKKEFGDYLSYIDTILPQKDSELNYIKTDVLENNRNNYVNNGDYDGIKSRDLDVYGTKLTLYLEKLKDVAREDLKERGYSDKETKTEIENIIQVAKESEENLLKTLIDLKQKETEGVKSEPISAKDKALQEAVNLTSQINNLESKTGYKKQKKKTGVFGKIGELFNKKINKKKKSPVGIDDPNYVDTYKPKEEEINSDIDNPKPVEEQNSISGMESFEADLQQKRESFAKMYEANKINEENGKKQKEEYYASLDAFLQEFEKNKIEEIENDQTLSPEEKSKALIKNREEVWLLGLEEKKKLMTLVSALNPGFNPENARKNKRNFIQKSLDWYNKQNRLTKFGISSVFLTGVVVSSGYIAPAVAGTYFVGKILRGLIGIGAGQATMAIARKIIKEENYEKDGAKKLENIKQKFLKNNITDSKIINELEQIKNQIDKSKRRRSFGIGILGAVVAGGVNTGLSLNDFFRETTDQIVKGIENSVTDGANFINDKLENAYEYTKGGAEENNWDTNSGEMGPFEQENTPINLPEKLESGIQEDGNFEEDMPAEEEKIVAEEPVPTPEPANSIPKEAIIGDTEKNWGVTQVLKQQIEANEDLAKELGYDKDMSEAKKAKFFLKLGKELGYIDQNGDEIRLNKTGVGKAAYVLSVEDGKPQVTEYFGDELQEKNLSGRDFEKETEKYENKFSKEDSQQKTIKLRFKDNEEMPSFALKNVEVTPKYNIENFFASQPEAIKFGNIIFNKDVVKIPMNEILETDYNPVGMEQEQIILVRNLNTEFKALPNETLGGYLERLKLDANLEKEIILQRPSDFVDNNYNNLNNSVVNQPFNEQTPSGDQGLLSQENNFLNTYQNNNKVLGQFLFDMQKYNLDSNSEFWNNIRNYDIKTFLTEINPENEKQRVAYEGLKSYINELKNKSGFDTGMVFNEQTGSYEQESIGAYIQRALFSITNENIAKQTDIHMLSDLKKLFPSGGLFSNNPGGIESPKWFMLKNQNVFDVMRGETKFSNNDLSKYLRSLSIESGIPLTQKTNLNLEDYINKAIFEIERKNYLPR